MKHEIKQKLTDILKKHEDQVQADKLAVSEENKKQNERISRFRGLQQSVIAPAMKEMEHELKSAGLGAAVDHDTNPQGRRLLPSALYSAFDFKSPNGIATLLIWQVKDKPQVDLSFSMKQTSYRSFSLDPDKLDEEAVQTFVSELVEEALKPKIKPR